MRKHQRKFKFALFLHTDNKTMSAGQATYPPTAAAQLGPCGSGTANCDGNFRYAGNIISGLVENLLRELELVEGAEGREGGREGCGGLGLGVCFVLRFVNKADHATCLSLPPSLPQQTAATATVTPPTPCVTGVDSSAVSWAVAAAGSAAAHRAGGTAALPAVVIVVSLVLS